MFLLGLDTRKNIVDLSAGVFLALHRLVYMSTNLFPPLASVKYLNLSNTLGGPMACAADDLEVSFAGDQIEFTSGPLRRPLAVSVMNHQPVKNPHSFDPLLQLQDHFGFFNKLWNRPAFAPAYDPNVGPHHMAGYFDDFAPHSTELLDDSVYGSSVESYVSPLDDDFFRRVGSSPESFETGVSFSGPDNRKRKLEELPQSSVLMSVPSFDDVDVLFNQILVKNQPDFSYVPQKINLPSHQTPSMVVDKRTKKSKRDDSDQYQCEHCLAKFKVKGYLTRHIKKHNVSKAFVCPFYQEHPSESNGTKCHPNGGFSRRDTFKTHLKAIHFIYPPGTKSLERRTRGGRCAGCFQQFANNKEWLSEHIEAGRCRAASNINIGVKQELVD